MRTLSLILSALLITLISTEVSASAGAAAHGAGLKSCRMKTPYGTTVTGYGSEKQDALDDARFKCGSLLIDTHVAHRGTAGLDEAELELQCINLNCQ